MLSCTCARLALVPITTKATAVKGMRSARFKVPFIVDDPLQKGPFGHRLLYTNGVLATAQPLFRIIQTIAMSRSLIPRIKSIKPLDPQFAFVAGFHKRLHNDACC